MEGTSLPERGSSEGAIVESKPLPVKPRRSSLRRRSAKPPPPKDSVEVLYLVLGKRKRKQKPKKKRRLRSRSPIRSGSPSRSAAAHSKSPSIPRSRGPKVPASRSGRTKARTKGSKVPKIDMVINFALGKLKDNGSQGASISGLNKKIKQKYQVLPKRMMRTLERKLRIMVRMGKLGCVRGKFTMDRRHNQRRWRHKRRRRS